MKLQITTSVATHIGDRKEQQDRAAIYAHPDISGCLLAVLADGMGGRTGGAMAAEQLLLKGKQNFDTFMPRNETLPHLLSEIAADAHSAIKICRFTSEQDPHTTMVSLVINNGEVAWVHCGDSRLYHFNRRKLISRTADHSVVELLEANGHINSTERHTHHQRHMLTSCLGGRVEPDCIFSDKVALREGDCFVLCSDGLWEVLDDQFIADTCFDYSVNDAASHLLATARERAKGRGDNLAVAIIRCDTSH